MIDIFKSPLATPSELIGAVKTLPGMSKIYQTRVRHYILEEHTKLVIGQFDYYFSQISIPMPKDLFRFLLTIHDIGKPNAARDGNIKDQYRHTAYLVDSIRPEVPFNKEEIDLCLAIIGNDLLGQYLQNKMSLEFSKKNILKTAGTTILSLPAFFKSQTIYYQCDVGAYTKDAGGIPYLEKLFAYKNGLKQLDPKRGILCFSPIFESKYRQLEIALV